MIDPLLTRRLRFTGATRRFLKRDSASKRTTIEPALLRRFTKYWRTKRAQSSGVNCFGFTRLGLMLRDCWRKIQSGNRPLQSTTSLLPAAERAAKKQKRA